MTKDKKMADNLEKPSEIEKPEIISVKELLQEKKLSIPDYQRPYKWTEKNVNQLIDDILFHTDKSAYRLGTLVVHKENSKVDPIVKTNFGSI